ncbi:MULTISPECIES: MIP/aquaporin family protein [unclassified Arthrobacter]|uniref:MIP/aquaporin family protein n=1 Tax=unclassified Arthrobacter TaxID=235627 RepID=UPI001D13473F|nr:MULTISPECIES: MIP/aquaporin family protein [unclassified Arthrobacter]MCC3274846.1 aquaporin family protein [Arthrobacter sp. zg-Y20]MCC9177560.1 aquaporin family protein [Arthrobacter sp. zg-Y750]MDK1315002.1 MIP/aquaporin family protein [Arthrobacter sp. zg.Y20]WIB04853.1 MIP/aquaporin family protein [Arthrobacter sp. zg-Y20]
MTLGEVFISELAGTAILIILGCGVVANVALAKTKGAGGGFLMVNWGWAIGVFAGVYAAAISGAHINPAVTVGLWASGADEFAPGVEVSFGAALTYFAGQMAGAIIGAFVAWLAYKKQFDDEPDAANILGVFSTGPAIRSYGWNLVTEIIGTFVLVFTIIAFAGTPTELGPLAVALVVLGIGASLGGPTGYAINPARDLGPRIVHALLPIRHKGNSDWAYAWVPVVGPLIGGALGGLLGAQIPLPEISL